MMLIAIGANLPGLDGAPPLETCRRAVRKLRALPGIGRCRLSRWYETVPVPPSPQPNYINGVARFEGAPDPAWMLARLHEIEAEAGRARSVPNAPRSLDLDIVDIGGLVRDAPDPVLPHPRAHERAFVLLPLAEVAPGWVHPRLHRRVDDLIAALPRQEATPLATEPAEDA
jgi:2-amino-4-hydroxy-6-hydroxymethyldihydropteridine diphosphokinase